MSEGVCECALSYHVSLDGLGAVASDPEVEEAAHRARDDAIARHGQAHDRLQLAARAEDPTLLQVACRRKGKGGKRRGPTA
jgi:hypothetical protein